MHWCADETNAVAAFLSMGLGGIVTYLAAKWHTRRHRKGNQA